MQIGALRLRITVLGLAVLALAATLAAPPHPAHAATFTVTKTADTNDGTCDGDCSLREAITAANLAPGLDTIMLPNGVHTIAIAGISEDTNATGDFDFTDAAGVIVQGTSQAGTIVDGAMLSRVFHVLAGPATFNDLTVRNGSAQGIVDDGGGVLNAGGVLTLNRCTFTLNAAVGRGGAVRNEGAAVILTDSTVSNNTAMDDGGGIHNAFAGDVTITGSTISGNSAGMAGDGIFNTGDDVTITNSTVSGNVAVGDGGGFFDEGDDSMITGSMISGNTAMDDGAGIHHDADVLTITGSTVNDNSASGDGGGLWNAGVLTVTNSTVSGNSATRGGGMYDASAALITGSTFAGNTATDDGGGLYALNGSDVTNSTLSGNTAGDEGGGAWIGFSGTLLTHITVTGNRSGPASGGGLFLFDDPTIDNSIVANNLPGGDCVGPATPNTAGNNLDSDGSCLPFPLASDLPTTAPLLGPLADNGGSTLTHALLPGSPAINAGDSALTVDQRGAPRPGTADNDIGAYERNHVDLAITKTDGVTEPLPGQALGYAIVVSNAGPDQVLDALVTDTFPPQLTAISWTCGMETGGGTCDTAAGVGNIAHTVDLPVEASVTFIVLASVVPPPIAGAFTNTATVAVSDPILSTELNPANNTAADTDAIPAPVAVLPGDGDDDDDDDVPTPEPACALGSFTQGTTGPGGGTVTGANGCVTVEAGGEYDIDIATRAAGGDQPPTPGSILVGGVIVEITATDVGSGDPGTTFDPPLTICVTIDGLDGATDPTLSYWDGAAWLPLANPTTTGSTYCGTIDHLTDFAVLGTLPVEEEEAPVVKEPEEEEPAPSATLTLVAGGQFVQWTFGDSSAAAVFASLKIAWLFNADVVAWTSFVPQLGISDFALADGAVLWLVAFMDVELAIP